MSEREMMQAKKTYNRLMQDIARGHLTIGTNLSEGTEEWNLRDMVSEMAYTLDLWMDEACLPWQDAHDETQDWSMPWLKNWRSECQRMKRFINRWKNEALTMECAQGHCSIYD